MKLGELFVELGFEVDDKTLKSFNSEVKDTLGNVLKLAGVTATGAGFVEIIEGASTAALRLRNLNAEFGVSQRSVQEYAAAMHAANPLISVEQATASYGKIAEYIRGIQLGKGAFALNYLGGHWRAGMSNEELIDQLFANHERNKNNPALSGGRYAQYLGEITGDAASTMIMLNNGLEEYRRQGAKGIVTDEDNRKMVEMRENIASMSNEWDKFLAHIVGTLAGPTTEILKAYEHGGFWEAVDAIGKNSYVPGLAKGAYEGIEKKAHNFSDFILNKSGEGVALDARSFFEAMGYNRAGVEGMLANMQRESGFDINARNLKGGGWGANGLMQWRKPRIEAIKRDLGFDIREASEYQQFRAIMYEMKKMGLDEEYRKITDPAAAGAFISRKFLIPGQTQAEKDAEAYKRSVMARENYEKNVVTQHNNINVYGNDPHQTGQQTMQIIKDQYKYAYSQTDQGQRY
jgi:hypothetical protein